MEFFLMCMAVSIIANKKFVNELAMIIVCHDEYIY